MGLLKSFFTWWDGPTYGTRLFTSRHGAEAGRDAGGNIYMRSKHVRAGGRERRWVIYAGENEASRVPAEWHGWLHFTHDEIPDPERRRPAWGRVHEPNPTGTGKAYLRPGALPAGGTRDPATGDYEAWTPGQEESAP